MKVPFRLLRRATAEPARALLLVSSDVADLLDLCVRLGTASLPSIHRVAGGFLLKLAAAWPGPCAGAVRLRALADNLFVPADADLVPELLDDERRGLVRDRGLVFLPGGQVLGFDPGQPLTLSALLDAGEPRRREWQALPPPPPRVERIHSIEVDLPGDGGDAVLEVGGEGIGTEVPRPDDAGMPAKLLGQAILGAGQALTNIGNLLGMKGVAGLGAQWMQKALSLAPRLSESLLGRQEAALRELLRQFRLGNLEEALRRALPLGEEGGRGSTPYTSAALPTHNLTYSLGSLLGGGGGAASVWFGGFDLQAELSREYRKAAEAAAARGDYRRAAFIYGKLLRDYRQAANVLTRGGLHHDAALLYLHKLNDRHAAARAFEAAGEVDRALQLYRELGEHLLAGDLLRRAGDEEAALEEYRAGADRLAAAQDYLAAGEVMLTHAGRPDLALGYLEEGWRQRPLANAVPCAVRLARLHAESDAAQPFVRLVQEAHEYFEPAGHDVAAGQFFNTAAALADRPGLAGIREEVRDHALLGLAGKLRQRADVETRPGDLVSSLLGQSGAWPAAAVADARYALAAAVKRPEKQSQPRPTTRVRLGTGRVTAACYAPATGDVFVGFLSGDIACFRPAQNEVVRIQSGDGLAVVSLAVSSRGQLLCVLQAGARARLSSYTRGPEASYRLLPSVTEFQSDECWLTPQLAGGDLWYGLYDGDQFQVYSAVAARSIRLPVITTEPGLAAALLLSASYQGATSVALLRFATDQWVHCFSLGEKPVPQPSTFLGWLPAARTDSPLRSPPLSWLQHGADLELAGLTPEGALHWSRLQLDEQLKVTAQGTATCQHGYRAAATVHPGLVAGVTLSRINWLRAGAQGLTLLSTSLVPLPRAAACFTSLPTRELLVVCEDGVLERVPLPVT